MAAVYDYRSSPLFSDAERAAPEFAMSAASVPNALTGPGGDRRDPRRRVMFGVLNRWNDSMATLLEDEPLAVAGALLENVRGP